MATLAEVLHKILNFIPWPNEVNTQVRDALHEEIDSIAEELVADITALLDKPETPATPETPQTDMPAEPTVSPTNE